jgi:hypothetical protein
LERKHQIAAVRNVLRLLQRYGAGTPPRPGFRYRINCDQSEGIGRDDSQRELEIARDVLWRMRHDEWLTGILDLIGRRRVFVAGRECLLWHDATAAIDEDWLRKNLFEPPTINFRVLRRKIMNAEWCDQPSPPLQAPTSAAPDRGAIRLPPVLLVKNSSATLNGVFPAAAGEASTEAVERKKSNNARTRCERWLIEKMRESPIRPKKKDKVFEEALTAIPGIWRRGFDRAWDRAIDATDSEWGRAGAPKKKSVQQNLRTK